MKYKPINGYTKASIINKINELMLNHPSKNAKTGACFYKAPDGNRCAIGVFIPEGHEAETNISSLFYLFENYPSLRNHMPLEESALCLLQNVHDAIDVNSDPKPTLIAWIEQYVSDE